MHMFDRGDQSLRYPDRPLLAPSHRSHSPEYRPPPRRSSGARGGPTRDVGGPRGYNAGGGPGRGGDDDINLLMNLSKMLS